jgi:hypothetical protein
MPAGKRQTVSQLFVAIEPISLVTSVVLLRCIFIDKTRYFGFYTARNYDVLADLS